MGLRLVTTNPRVHLREGVALEHITEDELASMLKGSKPIAVRDHNIPVDSERVTDLLTGEHFERAKMDVYSLLFSHGRAVRADLVVINDLQVYREGMIARSAYGYAEYFRKQERKSI